MEQHDQSRHRDQPGRGQRQAQYPSTSVATGIDAQGLYHLPHTGQYTAGSSIQHIPVTYAPDLHASDAKRQYSQYGSDLIYTMSRQPQLAQFGMPGAVQYYSPGQPTLQESQLTSPAITAQHSTTGAYPQANSSTGQKYAMDPSQSAAAYAAYSQYQQQQSQPPSEFDAYEAQIRHIFTLARDGALRDIGSRLLEVSQYLLGNVEGLDLTRDDEHLHDKRIRLWDDFNRAWLVPLQKQHDMTQQMMRSNQPLGPHQSIMSAQTLENLSSELVRLCDGIDKHGLVDYQMGVAEEEIMDLLLRCLSLLGPNEEGRAPAEPSNTGASRKRGG